jgi:hypothetical protein
MAVSDQAKRFADKASGAARDKGDAVAEHSIQAAKDTLSMSADSVRDFNLKMIEIARENTVAFFDFAQKVATTREPNAMMELFTAHTQKQMEMFSKQSQELTALGQKLASKSTETISGAFRS